MILHYPSNNGIWWAKTEFWHNNFIGKDDQWFCWKWIIRQNDLAWIEA